ncbi:uncharacterized protein LOC131332968 [Rhododendron vialii]|uniref:uncharacterized protein LOC131332968 n=1 Tax=Rhododendron vialii TaxID=182163 RepID=UPI00265D7CBA|nr:uncharacterized protein LOC131332968 [Rhododendron vialii]
MGHGLPNSVLRWTSQVVEALKGNLMLKFLGKVVMIGWQIWKSRNDFVFNSNPVDPETTMRRAIEALCEISGLRIPSLIHMDNPTAEDASSHWRAPDQGGLKINCDVAIKRNGRDAKCAAIIRDSRGAIVDGRVIDAKIVSSLHEELVAVRSACGMVKTMGLRGVTIESDNQKAIKLSVSELVPPWEVMAVVWDIRKLCQEEGISCAWSIREANGLAHEVASEALRGVLPVNWVSSPSSCLVSIVTRDSSFSL